MSEQPEEDEAGTEWERLIAEAWADDLADPRQDIYLPEDGLLPVFLAEVLTNLLDSAGIGCGDLVQAPGGVTDALH